MNLNFLGRGSAFNTEEGNNCAFYKNAFNDVFLIDCGEDVFKKIKENNVFDGIDNLYVAITHTHSDHIGSLPSLVLYAFFILKKKVKIILTQNQKHNEFLKSLFFGLGIQDEWVEYITTKQFENNFKEIESLKFLPTEHVAEFDSFGLEIISKDGIIYYSSDTNSAHYVNKYIDNENLDKMYVDTAKSDYPGNVHLSSRILAENVAPEKRHKVYCMHIDNTSHIPELIAMGFNVVETI